MQNSQYAIADSSTKSEHEETNSSLDNTSMQIWLKDTAVRSLAHRIAGFPAAGHLAVKQRVDAIELAAIDDFRRDSDLFGEDVRSAESQSGIQAVLKNGFQTRDSEMTLARMLVELDRH